MKTYRIKEVYKGYSHQQYIVQRRYRFLFWYIWVNEKAVQGNGGDYFTVVFDSLSDAENWIGKCKRYYDEKRLNKSPIVKQITIDA